MTMHRFHKVAQLTAQSFWTLAFAYMLPEEETYIRTTPHARRNLERRLIRALADTLLEPKQIAELEDLTIQDSQLAIEDKKT